MAEGTFLLQLQPPLWRSMWNNNIKNNSRKMKVKVLAGLNSE
jgi:hypothetical protein